MKQSPSWEANRLAVVKKFPAFYGTRKFITSFTSARQLSLSWASSIQSIPPHSTSWRSILILSSHLSLGFPSGLFTSGFHNKTLYAPLLSHIRCTCPAHLVLDFITRTLLGEEYRSLSSSLCSFLHSLVTLSLLGPSILPNTLFWNTLGLRSVGFVLYDNHVKMKNWLWNHKTKFVVNIMLVVELRLQIYTF